MKPLVPRLWRSAVSIGPLMLMLVSVPVEAQVSERALAGVIDFHCHSGPDSRPRSVNDVEIARLAQRAGMRGLVFKNHFTMTADRAALAMEAVSGIEIFGGIVLNRAVGGLNPEAVRQMTQFEGRRGKVVWLPTFDAEYDVTRAGGTGPFVSVVQGGKAVPELEEIFRLIAEHDLVLAMGHSSPEEVLVLIAEAQRRGVRKFVVTHALSQGPTELQLRRMAELGAILELEWLSIENKQFTMSDYVRVIRTVGAERCLISSDLGQDTSPLHTDGLEAFITALREHGISDADIDLMARQNPARLLGLDR